MYNSNNLTINSTYLTITLFISSILFYSITPLLIVTLIFSPLFFIYVCRIKVNKISILILLFCVCAIPAISQFFSITESIRFVLLVVLFIMFYFMGTQHTTHFKYFKILTIIFYCCAFVVVYYHFSMSFIDGFVLDEGRKGYYAREFLFIGRKYEFTFGVTHLNLYTAYCLLYSIIRTVLLKQKKWYLIVLTFLLLSILSESRGPVLFAIIAFLSIWLCLNIHKNKSFKFVFMLVFFMVAVLIVSVPILWEALKAQGHSGNNRLLTSAATDVSRLVFFSLGIEHLSMKPFGNVSIYTAKSDLQNYHNTFLTIANRNGIISFSFVLLAILVSFIRSIISLKSGLPSFLVICPILIYLYCLFFLNIEDVMRFDRFIYFLLAFQLGVSERLYRSILIRTSNEKIITSIYCFR